MHYKQTKERKTEKFVSTGCIATGSKEGVLTSSPLGSCVAVAAYDKTTKIGGLAHIMLPGKSPKENNNKYAENAITNLIDELKIFGVSKKNIEICLVGGANVLRKKNDSIADNLIISIFKILKKEKLNVAKSSLSGYERRTAKLNLSAGIVNFTVGDSIEKILYKFTAEKITGEYVMKKDLKKTKEQLSIGLKELRNKSKEREEMQEAANQQLLATEQQLRAANQQLEASNIEIRKKGKEAVAAQEYAENIISTLREPLLILDADLKIITANESFYKTFHVSQKDTLGNFVFELGNHHWNIPALRKLLLEILPEKSEIVDFEVKHLFDDIGQKTMLLNSKGLIQEGGKKKMILLAMEDITERKQVEETLKKRMNELEIFNEATVGRELKIIELKKEINKLLAKTGQKPKYEIPV